MADRGQPETSQGCRQVVVSWMKQSHAAVIAVALIATMTTVTVLAREEGSMRIMSTAFSHQGAIPTLYTCEGRDISPPLAWTDIPAGTKSLALIVDDPDAPDPAAPKMTWVHWVLYNLPATNGVFRKA